MILELIRYTIIDQFMILEWIRWMIHRIDQLADVTSIDQIDDTRIYLVDSVD